MKTLIITLLLLATPCASVFSQGLVRTLPKTAKQAVKRSYKKQSPTLKARFKAEQVRPVYNLATARRIDLVMKKTAAKDLLARRHLYNMEMQKVIQALPKIQALEKAPNAAALAEVKTWVENQIINKTLKKTLLTLLEQKKYAQMAQELSDYYAIPLDRDLLALSQKNMRETVVESALAYTKRHPHKPNLPLRELLKSEKVNARTKENIQRYLNNPVMVNVVPMGFKTMVRTAYKQHYKGVRQAVNSPEVQATVMSYNKTVAELRKFVAKHHRQPRWNAPLAERRLYNKLQLIMVHNVTNCFCEAETVKQEIRAILAKYPNRSYEEFYKDYTDFVKTFKRQPEPLPQRPNASPREQQLYDEMARFMIDGQLK